MWVGQIYRHFIITRLFFSGKVEQIENDPTVIVLKVLRNNIFMYCNINILMARNTWFFYYQNDLFFIWKCLINTELGF